MISAIILTFNEEKNIERCLKSLADLSDDVVIVDSFSTDRTLDICRRYNCRIFQNPFSNQATQFNWALDNVELKYEWIIRLDADEILPLSLKKEIKERLFAEKGISGYYLNRRMYWMNRWLKHGRMYPHYILRIFKKGQGRYENREEEHLLVQGPLAYMRNDFLEDNRINTLSYFIKKHLRTAESEVREAMGGLQPDDGIKPSIVGPKVNRTRWLKLSVYSRTPRFLRAFLYFFYRYILCLGFLDGKDGLIWHVLQAFWYRFYIDSRIYEELSGWQNVERDQSEVKERI